MLLVKAVDCQFPIRVKPRDLEWLYVLMSVDQSNPLFHLIVRLLLLHPSYSLRWKVACPAVFVYLQSVLKYFRGFWKPVCSVEPHENCPRTSPTQSLWMIAHRIRNPGSLVRIFFCCLQVDCAAGLWRGNLEMPSRLVVFVYAHYICGNKNWTNW